MNLRLQVPAPLLAMPLLLPAPLLAMPLLLPAPLLAMPLLLPAPLATVAPGDHIAVAEPGTTATDQVRSYRS